MPADAIVESELKALKAELSTAGHPPTTGPVEPSATEQRDLSALLTGLMEEVEQLLKEAEKDVTTHPLASVGAALLAGLVVGLLLKRR